MVYTTNATAFNTPMLAGLSGYMVSKVALTKFVEFLAVENPNVACMAYHPGIVDGNTFRASGSTPEMGIPMDNREYMQFDVDGRPNGCIARLSAGFAIWATLPGAKFLSGKVVWANWDVEELEGMEKDVAGKLTFGLQGWPFANV